ncbi:hypothetical protein COMA1_50012 [Candidatus Nitrospira nitrosa]|uniref:Uncharacterized protein n=1 Tax=Candidatus Nitrospira nitrosa TaxID=1742972 RepID=A0A0S4LNZ7_9BACT|nr:hypothetical protein COMA1_50012 [Candidatus Nitrospira nitrosa]
MVALTFKMDWIPLDQYTLSIETAGGVRYSSLHHWLTLGEHHAYKLYSILIKGDTDRYTLARHDSSRRSGSSP